MASSARIRVTVTVQPSGRSTVLIVSSFDDLRQQCSSKFRMKARRLFHAVTGEELLNNLHGLTNDSKLVVTAGDLYSLANPTAATKTCVEISEVPVTIIANRTFVEQAAIDQLKNLPRFYSRIKRLWGMPDLHAGQSTPIGCVVATEPNIVYPELIGTDIGCGMSFGLDEYLSSEMIDLHVRSELQWPQNVPAIEENHPENEQLGTIGAGNHFVELQRIEELYDKQQTDLCENSLYLLVHSGSRSLGERFLREFGQNKDNTRGLEKGTEEYENYMKKHDEACAWAKRNRYLIARRFLTCLGDDNPPRCLLDIWHNNVVVRPLQSDQSSIHLHRKGAAPSDQGRVIIPGSRGTHSYLVEPIEENQESSGYSLSHGAGRSMSRSKARQLFSEKFPDVEQLKTTDTLDSRVICEDKQLLYEEHPQAYKTIDAVIDDLVEAKLIRVLAKLRPLITYKTRLSH